MTPIIAFAIAPPGQPLGQQSAIGRARKLLQPRKQAARPDQQRHRLDQACRRVAGHRIGQPVQRPGAHQTVGIQHDHRAVSAAPSGDPVRDIADLAVGIDGAAAIENRLIRGRPQPDQNPLFLGGDRIILGIAEDEQRKPVGTAAGGQIRKHRRRIAHRIRRHLVVDRHQ